MAKKITETDARLVYRCGHCDAKCDGKLSIEEYEMSDMYLGRIDNTKKKYRYYCSRPCLHYSYIQHKTKLFNNEVELHTDCLDRSIKFYRETVRRNPEDAKQLIGFIKLLKSMLAFYNAWLAHKSEYELHELRLKANKYIADFLEDWHEDSLFMDEALKFHRKLNETNITLFN